MNRNQENSQSEKLPWRINAICTAILLFILIGVLVAVILLPYPYGEANESIWDHILKQTFRNK